MWPVVGWHGGNVQQPNDLDHKILRAVPPVLYTFLSNDSGHTPEDIEWIKLLNPSCEFVMRPYFDPGWLGGDREHPDYERAIPIFIEVCLQELEKWSKIIPVEKRHLQILNEQNMPRWVNQWEGFGERYEDMLKFDELFCRIYDAIKPNHPTWKIGWTPLTPGNGDAYFHSDMKNVSYYMHGPQAAKDNPTKAEIQAAIVNGPCYRSLMKADEYYAHAYVTDPNQGDYSAPWGGMRFVQYEKFFPKPMDVYITECGMFRNGQVDTEALINWYRLLEQRPEVKGTSLWILGTWSHSGFYKNGDLHPAVYALKEMVEEGPSVGTVWLSCEDRREYKPQCIIWHATDGQGEFTYKYIQNPNNKASYNYLIMETGEIRECVPVEKAAWHANNADGTAKVPGYPGINPNLISIGIAFEHMGASVPKYAYPHKQIKAAVELWNKLRVQYNIPLSQNFRHGEVDPKNRYYCPRDLDWDWFKSLLGGASLVDTQTLCEVAQQHIIPQNPKAALHKYITEHGWEHISGEFYWETGGTVCVCQVGYSAQDDMQHICYVPVNDWGNIRHVDYRNTR